MYVSFFVALFFYAVYIYRDGVCIEKNGKSFVLILERNVNYIVEMSGKTWLTKENFSDMLVPFTFCEHARKVEVLWFW